MLVIRDFIDLCHLQNNKKAHTHRFQSSREIRIYEKTFLKGLVPLVDQVEYWTQLHQRGSLQYLKWLQSQLKIILFNYMLLNILVYLLYLVNKESLVIDHLF